MWFRFAKRLFALSVNILNVLLAGNLPPFVTICVIVEEQGRFLVIESSVGRIAFPSGFVRWRELPVQAACREGKEETGLSLNIKGVVGYYPCTSSHFGSVSCLDIVFSAEVAGGALRSSVEGKPSWLGEQEVRIKMSAFRNRIIDDYFKLTASQREPEVLVRTPL